MKFVWIVAALLSTSVFASDDVVKSVVIAHPVGHRILNQIPNSHAGGEHDTKIRFEFFIKKDGTLWGRPLLAEGDERAKLGQFPRQRGEAVQISLAGYRAREFFMIENALYATVSDTVDPEYRYVMKLVPHLSAGTHVGNFIWALVPGPWSALMAAMAVVSYPENMANTCLFAATAGISYAIDAFCDLKKEWGRATEGFLRGEFTDVLRSGKDGDRLRVIRFVFQSGKVKDVLLSDREGKQFSLRKLNGQGECAAELTAQISR